MNTWTIVLPYSRPPLTLNGGTGNRYARAEIIKMLRTCTHVHAQAQKMPKGLPCVMVTLEYRPEVNRARDRSNLQPTMKPCLDGLALGKGKVKGYGLVADDDDAHVTERIVILPKGPAFNDRGHRLRLVIEEMH